LCKKLQLSFFILDIRCCKWYFISKSHYRIKWRQQDRLNMLMFL